MFSRIMTGVLSASECDRLTYVYATTSMDWYRHGKWTQKHLDEDMEMIENYSRRLREIEMKIEEAHFGNEVPGLYTLQQHLLHTQEVLDALTRSASFKQDLCGLCREKVALYDSEAKRMQLAYEAKEEAGTAGDA